VSVTRHLLITNDYLPKTGGIQVYLHELWRRLPSGEAAILTANSDPGAKEFDAKSEVVIERIPEGTLFLPTRKIRKYIEEAIARHDPELVILDPAWPLGLLGPKLSRPYGVILHGAEVTIPGRLPFTGASLRYILRNAELAICAGTYPEAEARRNAAEFMPAVVQVPPGVDLERFVPLTKAQREKTRAELDIPEGALVVASYSRLVPRKGMDVLIEASVQLKNEFPNLLVMIGGKGRDAKRLNNLATKLNAPVRFLGRVSDDLLPAWLGASDIFVMACQSRWFGLEQEGFGMVFGEAAAAGIPQVAGRSGGSHEVVRHGQTGLIVERPKSVTQLADAMRQLLADSELRESMGAESRKLAEENYSWDALAAVLANGLAPYEGGTQ